jgi:nitrous oxidase accessory protein NosD
VSLVATLLGTSLVLSGTGGTARAQTTAIRCGATVVTSIVLERDLIDCPTDGLIVGADNITIDLNGHTIDGTALFDSEWDGIDNSAGHDGVTIVNGTLQDFGGSGVYLDGGATGNHLADLVLSDDGWGVEVRNSSDDSILTSSIVGNVSAGILIAESFGTLIANNTLSNTRATAEVLLFRASDTLVQGNRMRGAYILGVDVILGSGNDVIGNVISGTRTTTIGVYMEAPESRIAKNEISGFDQAAVFVGADGIQVEKNSIHDSRRGVFLQGSFFGRPTGLIVRRNEIFNSDLGILVRETTGTLVKRNITQGGRIGIVVRNSTATVISKNRSDRNAEDGIQVYDPATTITHNHADLNGDLGIEAVEGVTDGGGNTARRNGNPAQCLNVDCSAGSG